MWIEKLDLLPLLPEFFGQLDGHSEVSRGARFQIPDKKVDYGGLPEVVDVDTVGDGGDDSNESHYHAQLRPPPPNVFLITFDLNIHSGELPVALGLL